METRSRKRVKASAPPQSSSSASSQPLKRARHSHKSANGIITSSSPILPCPHVSSRSQEAAMDSGATESSTSTFMRDSGKRNYGRDESQSASAKRDKETDNGKEKETEQSRDRAIGLSIDGAGPVPNDDNDSEGVSILHQNLTSASSALQGLLRKLGVGLDDLLPSFVPSSHQSNRLKRILSGLRVDGEEGRQFEALTQLCELLSIGTKELLRSFSVDSFVPVLVTLLNHESNVDIMLLAARALTHLCDALPSSCTAVVHYGAIPCFCAHLLTIEYMDLA